MVESLGLGLKHSSPQYMDAEQAGNESRFINHACVSYNCAAEDALDDKGRFVFAVLATRNILPKEELFLG